MRLLASIGGDDKPARAVDDRLYPVAIVDVTRYHDLVIVAERDQATVEHPVSRSGQGHPIGDNVGAILLHRPNMRPPPLLHVHHRL